MGRPWERARPQRAAARSLALRNQAIARSFEEFTPEEATIAAALVAAAWWEHHLDKLDEHFGHPHGPWLDEVRPPLPHHQYATVMANRATRRRRRRNT